jgi:AcrR family transcriptional regulator
MPRPKRTEQEIEAMRKRILKATVELLQQQGAEEVSTRKIADRVGVSHALLYSYFENRAAITQALRERFLEKRMAFFAESLRRGETGDALMQVRASLEWFVRLAREQPMLYQLSWRRSSKDPALRVDSHCVAQMLDHLSQLIRLCIERGQCVERDPALAAVMVFGMVNGTLFMYHSVSALGQVEEALLETEVIEAAMTYLTSCAEGCQEAL